MGLYTVFDASGVIIMSGACPDGQEYLYKGAYYGMMLDGTTNPAEFYVVDGAKSVGTMTLAGISIEDETFIIDTQTFTWKAVRVNPFEVLIGADAPESVINIVTAVTADLPTAIAEDSTGNTVKVTYIYTGVIGDTVDFSTASTNLTMDGAGHLGGTTPGVDAVLTEKPLLTTVATWDKTTIDADGVDAATLGAGLPDPTSISIVIITAQGAEQIVPFDVTDGSLVLKSLIIGMYSVTARAAGYKDYTVSITAETP
jgi:hypothetical protein